jgi:hypothetical protein
VFFHNCGYSNLLLSRERFAMASGIMGLIIAGEASSSGIWRGGVMG